MIMGISVLMSVYAKETPENLKESLDSIYAQTRLPDEIVIVEDGPLTADLDSVIRSYSDRIPAIKSVRQSKNYGLGISLNNGLKACSHELIARMDSDDISMPDRLKIQEEFLISNSDLSAVGSDIDEFIGAEIIRTKHMPTGKENVCAYAKIRNPLNHMTVMFKKTDIEAVGSYQDCNLLEDYLLWSKLLAKGYKVDNIPLSLVKARISDKFASKRGGRKYYMTYRRLRKIQYEIGLLDKEEYYKAVFLTAAMTLMPTGIRNGSYTILRKRGQSK